MVVKNATERRVVEWLRSIYGESRVVHQYYAPWCRNPATNRMLPFDIFIPHLNVVVEVDGPQHFNTIKRKWGSATSIRARDVLKMKACIDNGVALVRVPQEEAAKKTGTNWKYELCSVFTFLAWHTYAEHPIVIGCDAVCYAKHMSELASSIDGCPKPVRSARCKRLVGT